MYPVGVDAAIERRIESDSPIPRLLSMSHNEGLAGD
jgi:hypothetical protein